MPIYVYKCTECGYSKDVLQKMSDPVLTQCPGCHHETFAKQVTAAGFQLKGTGWYVTDFRGGGQPSGSAKQTSSSVTANSDSSSASGSSNAGTSGK